LAANLCFLNFIQPSLPGVFSYNIIPDVVNGSLWTLKVEVMLYIFVPLVVPFLVKRKSIFVFAGLYLFSFLFKYFMDYSYDNTGKTIYILLGKQFLGQIRFFISGAILLFYFDFFKNKMKWIFPMAFLIFMARYFTLHWVFAFFYPLAFAVILITFAYYFKKLGAISKYGDLSYGIYLYHYPVIQLFVHLGWMKESPLLLFFTCLCLLVILSWLSWHLLEKRFLKRTGYIAKK
jgi:peptidoglycan/LPS O-acetylase OafA/YrhL